MAGTTVVNDFASLVAFGPRESQLSTPLRNLQSHVYNLVSEAKSLLKSDAQRKSTFSPYIGRGILEAGLTAILFRADPFRAMTLCRFQSDIDFDHNSPNNISVSWADDIMCNADIRDPWRSKTKPESVSRALFSPYTDEILWKPALNKVNDHISSNNIGFTFPSVTDLDGSIFIGAMKGQARQLYSFWSKGIYGELFTIGNHTLDSITCDEKLKKSIDIVLDLAYVSHFISTSISKTSAKKATQRYMKVKEFVHGG
ncbi:hypothetical protein QO058_17655 [Bosea vestrisii]|uniref:hypothetical protein n=1 Tax=Bosea vestrisii TaxID=151416 RepID=UPI0024E03BF0|nr:hypothetical protein [Bosea vestrisii]WID94651.1 hypothetical protein QO058_17655 [Bosea vestrisii]